MMCCPPRADALRSQFSCVPNTEMAATEVAAIAFAGSEGAGDEPAFLGVTLLDGLPLSILGNQNRWLEPGVAVGVLRHRTGNARQVFLLRPAFPYAVPICTPVL